VIASSTISDSRGGFSA